jgi:hypothetical protein
MAGHMTTPSAHRPGERALGNSLGVALASRVILGGILLALTTPAVLVGIVT